MIDPSIKFGSRFLDLSGRLFTRWMVSDQFRQQRRPSGGVALSTGYAPALVRWESRSGSGHRLSRLGTAKAAGACKEN
jgi:hypothetical protein